MSASLLVGGFQHVGEAVAQCHADAILTVFPLPRSDISLYLLQQSSSLCKISAIEVDMKHRILRPFLLQGIDGQPTEQLLPSTEITFESGDKQALPETARTAEEINASFRYQPIDERSLVHVHITTVDDLLKLLYSDRVFHNHFSLLLNENANLRYFIQKINDFYFFVVCFLGLSKLPVFLLV
jgi:hypothetical protein